MNNFMESKTENFERNALKKELLRALEKARGRLAIAIAEESKATPFGRRKYYLETADHMGLCIARLRKEESHKRNPRRKWTSALEALRRISLKEGAHPLCDNLRIIVSDLSEKET